jgi:hypothetical protein
MSPQRWPNPSTATATWTTSCVSTPMTTCCAKLSSVTCSSELVVASPAAGQTCDGTVRGQAPDKSRPFGDDPCGALARGQILGKATTAPGGSRVTRAKAGPAYPHRRFRLLTRLAKSVTGYLTPTLTHRRSGRTSVDAPGRVRLTPKSAVSRPTASWVDASDPSGSSRRTLPPAVDEARCGCAGDRSAPRSRTTTR